MTLCNKTNNEKDHNIEKFRLLNRAEKIGYIWDYYRFHILVFLIISGILISFVHNRFTQKDPLLFTAFVNVSVSEHLKEAFTNATLEREGFDTKNYEVYLYENIYISDDVPKEDRQYEYASRLKTIAAINAKQLDTVIMDQRAFDIFSTNGYLWDLTKLDSSLKYLYSEHLISSEKSQDKNTGFLLTGCPIFKKAGLTEPIFFGIVKNSEHVDLALAQFNTVLD